MCHKKEKKKITVRLFQSSHKMLFAPTLSWLWFTCKESEETMNIIYQVTFLINTNLVFHVWNTFHTVIMREKKKLKTISKGFLFLPRLLELRLFALQSDSCAVAILLTRQSHQLSSKSGLLLRENI